jgi:predicted ATPase
MVYLKSFSLLNDEAEYYILCNKRNIFNSLYPLKIFPLKEFENITFDPITIFYGGNGSGKTTLLNIIGTKIKASKRNIDNKGELFDIYVHAIRNFVLDNTDLKGIKMISSDDVFDYLLDLRAINSNVNRRKQDLQEEYYDNKFKDDNFTIDNYEELKKVVDSKRKSSSQYIRSRLINNNIIEQSNGESALEFWEKEIQDHALYLLDEPENSLSAENQVKLAKFIEDSSRFYDCQFIISTHSPFLLGMNNAKIYDIDDVPVRDKTWTNLQNVRVYYDFFLSHKDEFEEK